MGVINTNQTSTTMSKSFELYSKCNEDLVEHCKLFDDIVLLSHNLPANNMNNAIYIGRFHKLQSHIRRGVRRTHYEHVRVS